MKRAKIYLGTGGIVVATVTFSLFVVALFTKGITHDILLEAAVFLVSVKLIHATYKLGLATETINHKLDRIQKTIENENDKKN